MVLRIKKIIWHKIFPACIDWLWYRRKSERILRKVKLHSSTVSLANGFWNFAEAKHIW